MSRIYDLIVVGGGPGGIGTVVEAKIAGFKDVLLIEKSEKHSQQLENSIRIRRGLIRIGMVKRLRLRGMLTLAMGQRRVP